MPSSLATVTRSADDLLHDAGLLGTDDVTGVERGTELHAGADERRLALDERDRLTLHVGAHERAVGVVVLEERDHGRRGRHHLARRDVHVVDLVTGDELDLSALGAHEHALLGEVALEVDRRVGLGDDVLVLLVGGQVVDVVGDETAHRPCGTASR